MNDILNQQKMKEILQFAKGNFIPVILDDTANFLINTLKKCNPSNVLEIGTAIGYSGLIILQSCKCNITTIEIDENYYNIAKNNFKSFDLSFRVNQILGDAKIEMEMLLKAKEQYDFIFLDGPKGQYIHYLPLIKQLLKKEGILFADNVYFKNLVKQNDAIIPRKKKTIVVNLRKFLKIITSDIGLKTELFEIGDGVSISQKLTEEL